MRKQYQQQHTAVAEPLDGLDPQGFFDYQHIPTDYAEVNLRLLDVGPVF